MKTGKIIVEIICLVLVFNFFYEGVYKLAYFQSYGFWLFHMPFLKRVSGLLNYLVPFGLVVLSLSLLVQKYRIRALYTIILISIIFILYIVSSYLFTNRLFWPYHALWEKPTWMQKMICSLATIWLAFIAIVLIKGGISFKRFSSNSLRNTPANAG